MDTRRLPLLVLLVLFPVPAQADRHTWECFTGLSPEKSGALSARGSCGYALWSVETLSPPPPPPAPNQDRPVGHRGNGTAHLRAARDAGVVAAKSAGESKLTTHAVFVVGEVAQYIAGNDSGVRLDNWMAGVRCLFLAQKPVEPFVHILGGQLRPPRSAVGAADAEHARTLAFGFGADVEINRSLHFGIVPVLRLQLDAVKPKDIDTYGRFTFGVSFRFEGSDH